MRVHHLDFHNIAKLPPSSALILGTFDGVHVGHKLLIDKAKEISDYVAVLLIYSNKKLTKTHQASGVLQTLDDRVNVFANQGINEVILLNLGDNLLALTPEAFISEILVKLGAKVVVVGEDFRFGQKALGTPELLKRNGDFTTLIVPPLLKGDQKISTSLIKALLSEGKMKDARDLLGNYYKLTGLVTRGFGLGSKIGYPTANISVDPSYFLPVHGVYFVRIALGGKTYFGMASLGYHPTVNEVKFPLLEVNIFDFDDDIYHQALTVEFVSFIRPEIKFATLEALIAKIEEDRAVCYKLMKEGEF